MATLNAVTAAFWDTYWSENDKANDLIQRINNPANHFMTVRQVDKGVSMSGDSTYIPNEIRDYVRTPGNIKSELAYHRVPIKHGHTVSVFFYFTKTTKGVSHKVCHNVAMRVWQWLYMIYNAGKGCGGPQHLDCYFYMTPFKKRMGAAATTANTPPLSAINANTGVTATCVATRNSIIIYRDEEWFKVFIHETLHTFGMDFSGASRDVQEVATKGIWRLFPVVAGKSEINHHSRGLASKPTEGKATEVNLYEAYTETWAELLYIMFCCSISQGTKREYMRKCLECVAENSDYALSKMQQILRYMGFPDGIASLMQSTATTEYRENTNILAYYVIRALLFANGMQPFLHFIGNGDSIKGSRPIWDYVYFGPSTIVPSTKKRVIQFVHTVAVATELYLKTVKLPIVATKSSTMCMMPKKLIDLC